jgi:hypothetical protein
MSDIKRWTWPTDEASGNWVLWTDHVAAVAEAEQRVMRGTYNGCMALEDAFAKGYEQGQRDERERIHKAVEGLPWAFVDPPGVLDTLLAVIDGETP